MSVEAQYCLSNSEERSWNLFPQFQKTAKKKALSDLMRYLTVTTFTELNNVTAGVTNGNKSFSLATNFLMLFTETVSLVTKSESQAIIMIHIPFDYCFL